MQSTLLNRFERRLTPNLCAYAAALLAFGCVLPLLVLKIMVPADRMRDGVGAIYGHDFAAFWAAARTLIEIEPGAAWMGSFLAETMNRYFPEHGLAQDGLRFHYPPPAMLALVPLGHLPLAIAFPLMACAGLAFLLWALWRIVPDWRTPLLALGAPLIWIVLIYGQWSLWLAALMACALMPVARHQGPHPLAAALFVMKPTLGFALPLTCLFARNGLTRAAQTLMLVAALILASIVAFGWEAWEAYARAVPQSQRTLMGGLDEMIAHSTTLGSAMQMLAVPVHSARSAQWVFSAAALAAMAVILRSSARGDLKAATIAAGTALAAPYFMSYDLAILAPAAAFYVRDGRVHGFRTGDKSAMILCAIAPGFTNAIQGATSFPAGFAVATTMFILVASRAMTSAAEHETCAKRNQQEADGVVPTERLLQNEH